MRSNLLAQPTISGRVLNANTGLGIIGIDLDVFDANGNTVTVTGARSGSDGNYTLRLPGPGIFIIRADASLSDFFVDQYYNQAFLPRQATPLTVGPDSRITNVDFRLQPGFLIRGFVRSGGAPLASIDLDLYALTGEFLSGYPAISGADGSFAVGALAPGQYYLKADPDPRKGQFFVKTFYNGATRLSDAIPITISGADIGGIDFDLKPGGTISGSVVDRATLSGLAAIDLDIFDLNRTRQSFNTRTDATGFYEIGPVPAGQYFLRVDPALDQGYARTYFQDTYFIDQATLITVSNGTVTSNVNLGVTRAGSIAGKIVDAVSSAAVGAIDLDVFDSLGKRLDLTAKSNPDGTYHLGPLPPGDFFVRAQPGPTQGRQLQYYSRKSTLMEAALVPVKPTMITPDIDFVLDPAGWIEGLIRNSDLQPLPEIDLDVFVASTGGRITGGDKSEISSAYVVGPLAPGQYKLRADPDLIQGYAVEYYNGKMNKALADVITVEAFRGRTGIDFVLETGGSVSGRVAGQDNGLPIAGIDLDVFESSAFIRLDQSKKTDADGRFTLGPLPAGSYVVRADPGVSATYVRTYYGGSNNPTNAAILRLAAGSHLTGIDIQLLTNSPPSAASIVLEIRLVTQAALSLSFSTTAGRNYVIEYSESLTLQNWQVVTTVTGDGTRKVVYDNLIPNARFYRIRML